MLLFGVSVGIWTQVLLYSGNILYRHPLWAGAKKELQMSTVGGTEFILSRSTLAQNRLHLGTWWGLHGVSYRPEIAPTRISARLRLLDKAYVYFLFGDADKTIGLRLSRSARWDSASVILRGREEIIAQKKIPQEVSAKVHEVAMQFHDGLAELYLDGSKVDEIKDPPGKGTLSFRGSYADAQILSVQAQGGRGPLLEENFRNTQPFRGVVFLTIGALSALCLLSFLFSSQKFFAVLLTLLTTGAIGFSYFIFDYSFWSSLQQSAATRVLRMETALPLSHFEKARFFFFEKIYEVLGARPLSPRGLGKIGYPPIQYGRGPFFCLQSHECEYISDIARAQQIAESRARGPRMLFIGTSQGAGAGANQLADTIFARTHRYLRERGYPDLESLNISISGGRVKEIKKFYEENLSAFHPDLVVIDLAFNDSPEELEADLPGWLEEFKKASRIVMIKEPTNNEVGYPNEERQEKAEEIAQRLRIPFLPLHDYMNDPETFRKGLVWWDVVHMTSFGQKLAAAWLDPQILKAFKSTPSTSLSASRRGAEFGAAVPRRSNKKGPSKKSL